MEISEISNGRKQEYYRQERFESARGPIEDISPAFPSNGMDGEKAIVHEYLVLPLGLQFADVVATHTVA